jgi:hypothetical protein
MMYKNAIARLERMRRGASLLDDADWLVTEYRTCFAPNIPRHNIAGANSACARANQDIVRADLGACGLFDPNITEVI